MRCGKLVYVGVILSAALGCTQQVPTAPAPAAPSASTAAPAPAGAAVLSAVRVGSHRGYDRVVFEFHGRPPSHHHAYVDQVTRDGSAAPIPLQGTAFLLLTMNGATMDNSFQVTDPARVLRYDGPRRLTPRLPVVQEVAEAGDFEADLSFGIGLSRRAAVGISVFSDPTRVIVDLAH
ncbi:AMIN-like domain-containing (lipo)protein [Allokutzneria albata]|uniref:AMIN-like domain-containing protein n=1 Tax=Allokutzneria albata TaxID=211114 RepID=A0A1G9T583_ALLAB|nr:hypothetical protein [Allokutzneria albata]SDM42778.1 hypothetical protein SAMN04489726_1563 [Allokutzneria albata]